MEKLVSQLKALGDENRFRIMMMLRERPLCSCEFLEVLDIAGGTLSAHLRVLRESGLIRQEKKGRWVQCRIADKAVMELLDVLKDRIETEEPFDSDLRTIRSHPPAAEGSCPVRGAAV